MQNFLSCDWGTSSFRLRYVDTKDLSTIAETSARQGISVMYQEWLAAGSPETERIAFYQRYLAGQIAVIEQRYGLSLRQTPLIISGMASASIGMQEVAYKALPIDLDAADFSLLNIEASESFPYSSLIISGVMTDNEVMRGEETMLAGCTISSGQEERLYILPGTHSKHITVKNGQALDIKTYMTGEFFELLSAKSILSASVKKEEGTQAPDEHFINGVKDGSLHNLMNIAFHVRTNALFRKLTPAQNYHYLSGLLIGSELSGLRSVNAAVTLVCNQSIRPLYRQALELALPFQEVEQVDADEALIKGQYRIASKHI